ncbi:hypothetical protein BXP70_09735 [Hymenobacter crusticola]|uniref:Uncharacterized protein n=1 Tax=Hymenobacter crusticola TaxID=1770526 RepID=A0A243WEA3_9BACT|nr:hypothetical protein BXP70_09735 [Hymenobacter crusticola]
MVGCGGASRSKAKKLGQMLSYGPTGKRKVPALVILRHSERSRVTTLELEPNTKARVRTKKRYA